MAAATATVIALALATAAAGVSVYGQQQQAKSQQALLNYNAALRDQEAADSVRDSRIRAKQQREANRRFLSKAQAIGATQGVVQSAGSPLEVLADNAAQLELGALEIERTGNIQAGQLRTQAIFDRIQGKSIRTGANYASASTILGAASSIGGMYAGYAGAGKTSTPKGQTVNYSHQVNYLA